jgi:3-oxoacyl-[acyl-carrier protein] reductase
MLLKDKVAIITGSTKGIGRGIALRFAREGARMVINGRNQSEVDTVVAEVKATGAEAIGVKADVTEEQDVERLFSATLQAFGTLDILVNNAQTPVGMGEFSPFLKMNLAGWNEYVRRNMQALFSCTSRAAQIMAAKRHGAIVNISSNGAARAHRRNIAYDSVKGAMDAFTRAVAVDLAPWNVRVNAIRPGMIEASWWYPIPEEDRQRRRAVVPLGREGYPEEVAWAVLCLAADDASYITGQNFEVDGGLLVQGRPPQTEEDLPVAGPDNIHLF